MKIIICYLLTVNLLAFTLMGYDKWKAKKHRFRTPEKTLFFFPFIGGALGGCLGMKLFHHKTRHNQFRIGFPLLLIIWVGIIVLTGFYFLF